MRNFIRRLLIGCVPTLLLFGCQRAEPVVEREPAYPPRLRELDFTPFEKALHALDKKRFAAVDRVVREGDLGSVAAALAAGEVTAEELTLYFLDRIRQLDGHLRSTLELNPLALEEARARDRERAAGKRRGPLHGIPVNVKDNIDTAAPLHTTAGAEILLDHAPGADAALVTKLREAGAVILGKASLSELAGCLTTDPPGHNAISGPGVNPYREGLPVSGSSSGSAISVSAFLTMGSIGTETSGSLIAPGASNGVVAMMPGPGVVSGEGIVPLIRFQDSAGPVGRSVRDVARLLAVIDEGETDYQTGLTAAALDGVAAGVLRRSLLSEREQTGTSFWLERIDAGLRKAGATTLDLEDNFAGKPDLLPVLFLGLSVDTMGYLAASGLPIRRVADLRAYNLVLPERRIPRGQNMLDLGVRLLASISAETSVAEDDLANLYEAAWHEAHLRAAKLLAEIFARNDLEVLVSLANAHSDIYATAGYPAITVPLGLDRAGAPNGVTFIGKPGHEVSLIGYAFAFESVTTYRKAPPDRAE